MSTHATARQPEEESGTILLVGARGFEPPTSCSQSRRATGLRYAPTSFAHASFRFNTALALIKARPR